MLYICENIKKKDMKKRLQFMMTAFASIALGVNANAQCPSGQGQLDIEVVTDAYGYEAYFEITPSGDPCGTNTIYSGGSVVVGCAGGGAQVQNTTDPSVYPDNSTIVENVGCFNLTDCFTLHAIDDWGDGGTQFNVLVDGVQLYSFTMGAADATNTYNFCMQLLDYDLSVEAAGIGTYYTAIPAGFAALTTLSFNADLKSNGQQTVTNATATAKVNDGTTDVHTATSTPVSINSLMTTNVALSPDYTAPGVVADYVVTFDGTIAENDQDMTNNTMMKSFSVTDSTLSRVATLQGSLGIGAGSGNDAKLGQLFSTPVDDAITSVTGYFSGPTSGDTTKFSIWDVSGGFPNGLLAQTAEYIFTDADTNGVALTLMLTAPLDITGNTQYAVVAHEYSANVTLATEAVDYEANTSLVYWLGNGTSWATADGFGFMVDYALDVNFGDIASVKENTLSNALVYPVPSADLVNFQLKNEVSNATVNVYSIDGSIVTTKVVSGSFFTVDVQDLAKGIYMVEIANDSNKEVYRIVRQ
jgi:hypothetical protein